MALLDFFIWLDAIKNLIGLPLRPQELVVTPLVVIAHRPPEARLQSCTNQDRVVSFANVVLVWCEGSIWEFVVKAVRFVDLGKEFSIVLLLQLEVFLLVFRVGQVFR